MKSFTEKQKEIIDYGGKTLLVSASAGTGKTTVMIERIARLIENGADVNELLVVTFTNLAAAEMKDRLHRRLSQSGNRDRISEQLDKLDNASICTIDSFCSDLLHTYFYAVDIDPSFSVLDSGTLATLRSDALGTVFKQYFDADDKVFAEVYKIFTPKRQESEFKKALIGLYEFSRCLEDFDGWYAKNRQNLLQYDEENPIVKILLNRIRTQTEAVKRRLQLQLDEISECGWDNLEKSARANLEVISTVQTDTLQNATETLGKLKFPPFTDTLLKRDFGEIALAPDNAALWFGIVKKAIDGYKNGIFNPFTSLCRGASVADAWQDVSKTVVYLDKIAEILQKFHQEYFAAKKQRDGVDFGDLEQLTLQLLQNEEVQNELCQRYKLVFVDEYQDTNALQEAIILRVAKNAKLFMVGDIKQSIYGFRGSDPTIFAEKYERLKNGGPTETAKDLNDNFRSNCEILDFVNEVFSRIMSADFGTVDYANTARLNGTMPAAWQRSISLNLIVKVGEKNGAIEECPALYDITAEQKDDDGIAQGDLIAQKIKSYVGRWYKDKNGTRCITYGDIVILMRGMTDKSKAIYNTLVEHNIPVVANFKSVGYVNKEVREIINFLRVLDNPYNDVYLAASCLSPFGGFSADELAQIKIATSDVDVPFYTRLQMCLSCLKNADITTKIDNIIALLDSLRFFAQSAPVDQVALELIKRTNYNLYVQGFPNGALRLRKTYAFVDGLKNAGYAQSLEKFFAYTDAQEQEIADSAIGETNAVRIMTMHASKGLEFPVVIIAGAESDFTKTRSSGILRNNDVGLAIPSYDLTGMYKRDNFASYALQVLNKEIKTREEEMRLLYVALTRAECALEIVGTTDEKELKTPPTEPTNAKSHLDFIVSALKQKYGDLQSNAAGSVVNVVRHLSADEQMEAIRLCEQRSDKEAVLQQIYTAYAKADQLGMPSKIVSSALDKEFIDIDAEREDFVLAKDNDRNEVGTAYHKVYQYVKYDATKEEIIQTIDGLVNDGKIDTAHAKQLDVDLIYDTLNNPQLRKIMSRGKVYHEMPFMLYVPYNSVAKDGRFTDDVMLQGVIDLLIMSEDYAVVVDFKYSKKSESYLKQHYSAQLQSYRLAVQKICGIEKVDSYILSVENNKLINM